MLRVVTTARWAIPGTDRVYADTKRKNAVYNSTNAICRDQANEGILSHIGSGCSNAIIILPVS